MTRCPATLWLAPHAARWTQKRDARGRAVAPHTLVWTCDRCGAALGETTIGGGARRSIDVRAAAVAGDEIPVCGPFGSCEKPLPRVRLFPGVRR
jgi:hypothetical protein